MHINNFVARFKWHIITIGMTWFIISIFITSNLKPISEPEKYLPDDHPRVEIFVRLLKNLPVKPNAKPDISFMWGTSGMDTSKVNFWDISYIGEVLFDEKFGINFHNKESQIHFLNTCNELNRLPFVAK